MVDCAAIYRHIIISSCVSWPRDGSTHGIRSMLLAGVWWLSGLERWTGDRGVWVRIPQLRFGTLAIIPFNPLCRCLSEDTLKAVGPFYLVFLVSILQTSHLWTNTGVVSRELSFSRLECGVHDRLHIYPLCGIFYFPMHSHHIEGTIGF